MQAGGNECRSGQGHSYQPHRPWVLRAEGLFRLCFGFWNHPYQALTTSPQLVLLQTSLELPLLQKLGGLKQGFQRSLKSSRDQEMVPQPGARIYVPAGKARRRLESCSLPVTRAGGSLESSPLPHAGSHPTGGRRVEADSGTHTSSGNFFPLSLGRLSSLERGKWREGAHGWCPCGKEVGKTSALAIPGPPGPGPENPQGTKFPGSTQHHDRGYSLTLSKSGRSASASCRPMGTGIVTFLSWSILLSTERVSPTSSPSAPSSSSTRLSGKLCNLLACVEHKAVLQSYGRLL